MKESGETEDFIINGFWIQNEYCVFITINKENVISLEIFDFKDNEIVAICDKVFFCKKNMER